MKEKNATRDGSEVPSSGRAANVHDLLRAIPVPILERIAHFPILKRLASTDAPRVHLTVTNHTETKWILRAARNLETLFSVGPRRLTSGSLTGAEWDEGLREVRNHLRGLADAIHKCSQVWKIPLEPKQATPKKSPRTLTKKPESQPSKPSEAA